MKKVLIMTEAPKDDWAYVEWLKNEIDAEIIFKKVNKVLRLLRRIWIRYHLPFAKIWYADWETKVKNADLIIVHISYLTLDIISYLNGINPNAKCIAWYWNCVDENTLPSKIKGNCEKWSFDIDNCINYHMRYNHQYYFKTAIKKADKILWDIYFCGSDVGRGKTIIEFYKKCQEYNISTKFQVVYPETKDIPEEIISKRVSYDDIKSNISKSRAILELTRKGQSGFTIRLMEAVFFGKKLITDNVYVKNEEFYNENNIFILGERSIDDLVSFLKSDFIPYSSDILDKYDVKQWLLNFNEEEM